MTPEQIVQHMMEKDTYSQWLGIEIIHVEAGSCELKATVREEMLNGHRIAHGGISYALSDSALAFASNSRGQKCVSIETSIAHIAAVQLHDTLHVVCTELNCGKSIGRYESLVYNQHQKLVAKFNGTVFRKSDTW